MATTRVDLEIDGFLNKNKKKRNKKSLSVKINREEKKKKETTYPEATIIYTSLRNVALEWLDLLLCILKTPVSILGPDTGYPDRES
jgi:hypothetical protein